MNLKFYLNRAVEAMKLFVDLGVDPSQKDKINQTALYYAARESKFNCCKFLLEKRVPLNDKDLYQQTPIYYAAREGATNIIELFLNYGASINVEDKYGQTCIFYAIKYGHDEATEFLIKAGADLKRVDKKKLNLYLYSLKNNRPSIAEMLVRYGATAEDNTNKKMLQKKTKIEPSTEEESKYKKYVLIKFTEDGKARLSQSELGQFFQKYKEISSILNDSQRLREIENEVDERLKDTEGWEKTARKIMLSLWKVKDSTIFLKPVDPVELNIPDYFTIIKKPMDFSTIKKKLNSGLYTNFRDFDNDMKLVFYNCILYNGVSNIYYIIY